MIRLLASDIIDATAEHYGLSRADLVSADRSRPVAHARQMMMAVTMLTTNQSLSGLGRMLNRDHATISFGVHQVGERLMHNPLLGHDLGAIIGKAAQAAAERRARLTRVNPDAATETDAVPETNAVAADQRLAARTLSDMLAIVPTSLLTAELQARGVDQ